jgi:ABC-type cobalamin/Fe3+-siderophores transport system ATPase subunit
LKEGENMKVKVENLNFKYPGHQALKDVSFVIENGEFLTVLGQNGAGKSTLIDCLINDNPTEAGKIFYNDVELHKFHNWQKNRNRSSNNGHYQFRISSFSKGILTGL